MPKGKLKPKDYNCIQRNYKYLKENLDALQLIDFLFQNGVLTWEEKEKIRKKKSHSKRNEKLLNLILHAGPGEAFSIFLKSLEPEYNEVLKQLKRGSQEKAQCTCNHHMGTIEQLQKQIEEKDEMLKKYTCAVQKVTNEKEEAKRPNIFIAFFKSIHIHKHGDNDEVTTETHQECQCLALTDSGNGTYRAQPTPLPAIKWK